MRYIDTRGKAKPASFSDILLEGLAPGGGLYMPAEYPKLTEDILDMMRDWSYTDIVAWVFSKFSGKELSFSFLQQLADATYTPEKFGSAEVTPVKWLEQGRVGLLQLSNGPTLAFKDVPLQFLGNLMEHELQKRGDTLNILGATSGDTGSAAEYAVRGKSRQRIFMLSPHGRMSRFQQRQMYTLNEPNIFNLVVNGTFDDCQATVKGIFADAEFKKKYKLGAVNSINWARIAAQVVYYIYGYLRATKHSRQEIDVSVPSGNFGNAFAAHVARQMGVPIRRIIVATNENDVLYELFTTGAYRVRKGNDVLKTSSPSMDIASASNFERLVFDSTDRDPELTRDLFDELAHKGKINLNFLSPLFAASWRSGRATERDVDATIRQVYSKYGVIIDPHTAVGMFVGLRCYSPDVPLLVAETAQPVKFPDVIRRTLGFVPPVPEAYEHLEDLQEYKMHFDPDPEAIMKFIASRIG